MRAYTLIAFAAAVLLALPAGAQEGDRAATTSPEVAALLGVGQGVPAAQPATPALQTQAGFPATAPSPPQIAFDPEEIKAEVRQEAFDAALDGMLPLTPEEIEILLQRYDTVQETVMIPPDRPKPIVAVETASLDPGSAPLTVKVAKGNVSTVSFLDISGAPWPVEDITWAGDFQVIESGTDDGTHILRITPLSDYAYGNISVRLSGLATPLILTLATARDEVPYRFDAIVQEYGPFASAPLIQRRAGPTAGGAELSRVLEGVVPERLARLAVSGVDGRTSAYAEPGGDVTYVRTPLTLLSPGWNAHVASADGMKVYTIGNAPVLLLSDKGRMVRAYLSEREDGWNE